MSYQEIKPYFKLAVDLAGGTTQPIIHEHVLTGDLPLDDRFPDERALYDSKTRVPSGFQMRTQWNSPPRDRRADNVTANPDIVRIGTLALPSQVVRLEHVLLPGDPKTITMFPKIPEEVVKQISLFETEVKKRFIAALLYPIKATIFLVNDPSFPPISIGIVHLNDERMIWEANPDHIPTLINTSKDYSIYQTKDSIIIEIILAKQNESGHQWLLISGAEIKLPIDLERAQTLQAYEDNQLDWAQLSPHARPYVELRKVSHVGRVTTYQ